MLRLPISTVEDRGDATAWRETLRPHGLPVRPGANGGIYYEVVRSKGMYLLRRSPESAWHENAGIRYQNAKKAGGIVGGGKGEWRRPLRRWVRGVKLGGFVAHPLPRCS